MTLKLSARILALFAPDAGTEMTGRRIVKELGDGPMQTNRVYAALRVLVADGELQTKRFFADPCILYRLPPPPPRPRSVLIDEAVRSVAKDWVRYVGVSVAGVVAHHDIAQDGWYPTFESCNQCRATIAAIRTEFHRLSEARTS